MTAFVKPREEGFEVMKRMEEEYKRESPGYFIQIINSKSTMVLRLHAVCALADVGDELAVPTLAKVLKSDPDPLLRHEAAFSLGQMGLQSGIPPLIDAMLKDSSDIVRHEAAAALGSIGNQSAHEALKQALNDPSDLVSGSARASLYNLDYLQNEMNQQTTNTARNPIRP
jgi:HEAT repeat protein